MDSSKENHLESLPELPPGWEWKGHRAVRVSTGYQRSGTVLSASLEAWHDWELFSGITRRQYDRMRRDHEALEGLAIAMRGRDGEAVQNAIEHLGAVLTDPEVMADADPAGALLAALGPGADSR